MSKVTDVKKASAWLKMNRKMFKADIDEPWIASTPYGELQQFIDRELENGTTMDDLRDNFMFNFNNRVELNEFQRQLRLQENISVNCCLLGLDYLKENVIQK
jgi:hypothetical protein